MCLRGRSHKDNKIPCGTKFLREFIFGDWPFFVFCGTKFFAIRTDGFFLLGINFSNFQKVQTVTSNQIDNIFVFIE